MSIKTKVADLSTFEPEQNHYGSVISISAHLPSSIRKRLYPLIEFSLKPEGNRTSRGILRESAVKDTGGPKDIDMLMTTEKVHREFSNLEPILLREVEREVAEGEGHTGMASVVQFIGKRKV